MKLGARYESLFNPDADGAANDGACTPSCIPLFVSNDVLVFISAIQRREERRDPIIR